MDSTSLTLLEKLRRADPEAWVRFVRLYTPLILSWAHRRGLRDAEAEDLAQNVMVELIHALPEYRRGPGQSFRGWLGTIARRKSIDFIRRQATRALPGANGLSGVGGEQPDAVAELDEAEYRLALIRRALEVVSEDFDPTTVAAFRAVSVRGRSVAEVADELGTTAQAVYKAQYRVLSRIREHLDGFLD